MAVRYITEVTGWNPHLRENNVYRAEIEDINYVGDPVILEPAVSGISLEYQNNELIAFPAVSPSFLNINLIATADFSLINLFTDNERNLPVTLYRDNVVFGRYIIIPSNTKEPFIDPPYQVSLRAVDGLGLLDKYKYTSTSGQASILTVINRCLTKLGLSLNINTFSTIMYDGMAFGQDVFHETLINQERFDGKNCGEVVEELMKEWVSGIFQVNGEWFLIRYPDYLKALGTVTFKSYDSLLNPITPFEYNPSLTLGANVGDIIHCNTDQMRSMNLAYKQVSIRYEYGFLKNLLNREQSLLTGFPLDFDEWTRNGGISASPRSPFSGSDPYAIINGRYANTLAVNISLTNPVPVDGVGKMKLNITFNANAANGIFFAIKYESSTQTLYWDSVDEEWQVAGFADGFFNYREWASGTKSQGLGQTVKGERIFDLPNPAEAGATINILILPSWFKSNNIFSAHPGLLKVYEVTLSKTSDEDDILSETHTVVNNGDYSQIPDIIEVSTGESEFSGYLGTMFKSDGNTPTNGFSDDGGLVYKKFLDLAAKDILFQHGKPMSVYEGSVLGTPNFLSRININELNGIFIPMSLRYDFRSSVTEAVLIETNTEDIPHTVLPTEFKYEEVKTTNQQG